MPFTVLQTVLIFAVALSLVAIAIPFLSGMIQSAMDSSEIKLVQSHFASCADKILETARTGTGSRCFIAADRGRVTAHNDSLQYEIVTKGKVCDSHPWVTIDKKRYIEQRCDVSEPYRTYKLRWRWPSEVTIEATTAEGTITDGDTSSEITFEIPLEFETLTVKAEFQVEGFSGKNIDIARISLTEEKVVMSAKIY